MPESTAPGLLERFFVRRRDPRQVVRSTRAASDANPLSEELLRKVERLSLRVRRQLRGGPAGEHVGRGSAASLEFADHRPYAPGDDFRRIDWTILARLDELTVRVTEAREDIALYLIVDCSASMSTGQGEKARLAKQLASGLAYLALNQLDVVRIYGMGSTIVTKSPRYSGRKQSGDAFRRLQSLPVAPETNLDSAFGAFLADRPTPGLVLVLSDLLNSSDYRRSLRRLVQAGFEVAMVHILSEAELKPRLWGDVELIDSETGETIKLSVTLDTLEKYARDLEHWKTDISDFCKSIGIRYVPIPAERSLDAILLGDFRRHGLLE
jgi:uncharacterized protein (DUF58 family)